MSGGVVFELTRCGPHSLAQANEIVNILNRVTAKFSKQVNEHIARLEALGPGEKDKTFAVEQVISGLIEEWNGKVRKLGGLPKGLWLVDFDSGEGYYCWKYPESEIKYWHDHKSGFASRVLLTEKMIAKGTASPNKTLNGLEVY